MQCSLHFQKALLTGKTTNAAWRSKPSFYAVSTNDRTINPDLERFMAKRMGAKTVELEASHVSMISQPKLVAALDPRSRREQLSSCDRRVSLQAYGSCQIAERPLSFFSRTTSCRSALGQFRSLCYRQRGKVVGSLPHSQHLLPKHLCLLSEAETLARVTATDPKRRRFHVA